MPLSHLRRSQGALRHRRPTLDYLELHKLVEPLNARHHGLFPVPYRARRPLEQTSLLELRFSPYLRTDPSLDVPQRIAAMGAVVEAIAAGEGARIRRGCAARAVPPHPVVR